MKNINIILPILLAFTFGCANQIKNEERIEQSFPYESPLYIDHSDNEASGNTDIFGNIVFSKEKVDIEVGEGENKKIEELKIRTVTFENDPNEIKYRTNKGSLNISILNDTIRTVHWIGDGFSILFTRKKLSNRINVNIPMPLDITKSGWQRITIAEVGTIDLPPIMEVQGEDFKNEFEDHKGILEDHWDVEISIPKLIFQPLGTNAKKLDALGKYSRIMYEMIHGEKGEFSYLTENISLNDEEIYELDLELKNNYLVSFNKASISLVEWYPVVITSVNEMPALLISYKRKFNNEPIVFVKNYRFQDYDKIHSLTFSYRINEKDIWEKPLEESLNSFRITNFN